MVKPGVDFLARSRHAPFGYDSLIMIPVRRRLREITRRGRGLHGRPYRLVKNFESSWLAWFRRRGNDHEITLSGVECVSAPPVNRGP